MRVAIIGGGAAGFFLAVNLKERCPDCEVTILERSHHLLAKVAMSGGGRCNCTNNFESVRDLSAVYPRGHRLMKRLFKQFDYRDAYQWFEHHGVALTAEPDGCVFPASQDAQTIIQCFLREARRLGIIIREGVSVTDLSLLTDYDRVVVTTGGMPKGDFLGLTPSLIVPPVPSLFTFRIDDERLWQLAGNVTEAATAFIPGTSFRASGPLLITHWGMSGPAILRLSSYAARHLSDHQYRMPLSVNWTGLSEQEVRSELQHIMGVHPQKQVNTVHPFGLTARLWTYIAGKAVDARADIRWQHLTQKEQNRLVNMLTNDTYTIAGRAPFKDEFVTCGGVALTAVDPLTLQCKTIPRLHFAGEVLDIDGVTGGFNFQAAWTTAFAVAQGICPSEDIIRTTEV